MKHIARRNFYVTDMFPLERSWLKPQFGSKQNSLYLPGPVKTINFQTEFVFPF